MAGVASSRNSYIILRAALAAEVEISPAISALLLLAEAGRYMKKRIAESRVACYKYIRTGDLPTDAEISSILGRKGTGLWELMDPVLLAASHGVDFPDSADRADAVLAFTHFYFTGGLWLSSIMLLEARLANAMRQIKNVIEDMKDEGSAAIRGYLSRARLYVNLNPFASHAAPFERSPSPLPRTDPKYARCIKRATRAKEGGLRLPMPLEAYIMARATPVGPPTPHAQTIYYYVYEADTLELLQACDSGSHFSTFPPGIEFWTDEPPVGFTRTLYKLFNAPTNTAATAWVHEGKILVARMIKDSCHMPIEQYAPIDAYVYCSEWRESSNKISKPVEYPGSGKIRDVSSIWGIAPPENY
jgi:hypothetical protein